MKGNHSINGYILVYKPHHKRAHKSGAHTGYVYEHILKVENSLGRELTPDEVVHHIDENRSNNNLNNLLVLTRSEHTLLHRHPNIVSIKNDNTKLRTVKIEVQPKEMYYCTQCGDLYKPKYKNQQFCSY